MLEDGTGYLRVATFNKGKAHEIAAKIKELESQGAHKIILDLRNCAGRRCAGGGGYRQPVP